MKKIYCSVCHLHIPEEKFEFHLRNVHGRNQSRLGYSVSKNGAVLSARRHKGRRKPSQEVKVSIIDHTTTCPYCGHRLLHKNRAAHIKQQHPDHYDSEIIAKRIDQSRKPAICLHCQASMQINELEDHIRDKHPFALQKAEEHVREKERLEATEKRKRRARIAQHLLEHGYSVRIDRPIKTLRGSLSLKHKLIAKKMGSPSISKKNKSLPKKSIQPVAKSKVVSKPLPRITPSSSKSTSQEILENFFCQTCGRDIVAQAVARHQMDDFFLRRQVRWWIAGNGSSLTVQCPICEQETSQSLLSSHLQEKHPLFYRFATT